MFQVSVTQHFDAAHALREYGGKCENLHGHRFQVVATVEAGGLNAIGLAYDFVELKGKLKAIMDGLDHTNLNEVSPFDRLNPSSENIALVVFERLQQALAGAPVKLTQVQVWESPENAVTYRP